MPVSWWKNPLMCTLLPVVQQWRDHQKTHRSIAISALVSQKMWQNLQNRETPDSKAHHFTNVSKHVGYRFIVYLRKSPGEMRLAEHKIPNRIGTAPLTVIISLHGENSESFMRFLDSLGL
ncbi:MAG TPA: hypothetical protein VJ350_08890 [Methanoregula sp.]|nr:hypothetical protein [Methanoregula sp.]